MRLTTIAALFVTLAASALPDGARDGKYSCGYNENVVRVILDTTRPWLKLEDANGTLEGMPQYRTDKREQYDEYLLPSDSANGAYYLRFWKQGPVTWHYCWGCGTFKCTRE